MSGSPRFDVVGLGGCAWDLLGIISRYPQPGQKTAVHHLEQAGGGQVATAMVAVARVGGHSAFVGTISDDDFSHLVVADFAREGVDTSHVTLDPGQSSHFAFCAVLEDTGERAIFYAEGTKRRLGPADLDADFLCSGRCLHMDTYHPMADVPAARFARAAGLPVVMDLERVIPQIGDLLRLGTHPVVPEHFLLEYTGESDRDRAAAKVMAEFHPEALVVTVGARGCIGYQGGTRLEQPAYVVDPTVDTTGAGDVFHGAFAYGLALGYDLATNMKFATMIAGLKCRSLGGRASIPTREELQSLWPEKLP
jgi:sugar/nucleoside kinase (ribokinase family)